MSNTRVLTVSLETVTPMFMGGAEPRGVPELRPPAFRGALRYWLRAALGGVYGDDATGLERVRTAEATVFGSTDERTSGVSAVTIRTGDERLRTTTYSQIAESKDKSIGKPGIAYLFFAARGTRQEKERSALLGTFTLKLCMRPNASGESLTKVYTSLWLLTHFGGLGSRSRRGAGALQITDMPDGMHFLEALPLAIQSTTPAGLVKELEQGLNKVRQLLGAVTLPTPSVQKLSTFDIIHPKVCRLWVLNKTYTHWNSALDEVGRVYQGFRNRRAPDYDTVKAAMTGSDTLAQPVQRATFGLPVPFYYRSLGGDNATLESEGQDRRSSPLWMRVVKLGNGSYTVVLLWFQSEFLPPGEQLKLRRSRATVFGDVPDSRLIETFITQPDPINRSSLKDRGLPVIEVSYA